MFGAFWPVRPDPQKGDRVFRVLKYADKEWTARHCALLPEHRDIHFDPRILAPSLKAHGCELGLAVTGDPYTLKNFIMQPVLVTKDGQLRHGYQFGGPISHNPNADLIKAHEDGLKEWATKRGVTNEFCILNPFLWKEQLKCLNVFETQWAGYSQAIDLSHFDPNIKSCVEVRKHHIYTNLHHFLNLNKQGDVSWFEWYAKFIYPHLLIAHFQDKIVGAALVAHKGIYQAAYYHFEALSDDCPAETHQMLIQAAAETVKGAKYLYLNNNTSFEALPTYVVQKQYV